MEKKLLNDKDNLKEDFKVNDSIYLLKKIFEKHKGGFIILFTTGDELCNDEFEITDKTEVVFSEEFMGISENESSLHIYRLSEITHIRKVLET